MIRARFKVDFADCDSDPRPVVWPINHPYWVTGQSDDSFILVAYADGEDQIRNQWPEAYDIDTDEQEEYLFTDRFPRPEWLENSPTPSADPG